MIRLRIQLGWILKPFNIIIVITEGLPFLKGHVPHFCITVVSTVRHMRRDRLPFGYDQIIFRIQHTLSKIFHISA